MVDAWFQSYLFNVIPEWLMPGKSYYLYNVILELLIPGFSLDNGIPEW